VTLVNSDQVLCELFKVRAELARISHMQIQIIIGKDVDYCVKGSNVFDFEDVLMINPIINTFD
jgi:hypothetical protein